MILRAEDRGRNGAVMNSWSMGERPPIRLLVADDSDPMRTVLRVLLELDGRIVVVAEAADGAEAVRLAEEVGPDCVLLDLDMPVLDGVAALAEIRCRAPRSKVVVFSGFDGHTVAQVLAAGATACLEKLAGLRELAPTIVRVCPEAGSGDPVVDSRPAPIPLSRERRVPRAMPMFARPTLPAA